MLIFLFKCLKTKVPLADSYLNTQGEHHTIKEMIKLWPG